MLGKFIANRIRLSAKIVQKLVRPVVACLFVLPPLGVETILIVSTRTPPVGNGRRPIGLSAHQLSSLSTTAANHVNCAEEFLLNTILPICQPISVLSRGCWAGGGRNQVERHVFPPSPSSRMASNLTSALPNHPSMARGHSTTRRLHGESTKSWSCIANTVSCLYVLAQMRSPSQPS